MKRQLQIFLAGAMVVIPLALTVYLVWWAGSTLDKLGRNMLPQLHLLPGLGAVIVIVAIYLIGLLTHFWIFRAVFALVERVVSRLPGIKTVYEAIRDLMKLFGGGAKGMGRAVRYKLPGTDVAVLGILTNENPGGAESSEPAEKKVAVFLPFSYMFGGPTIYVSPEQVEELNMSVEQVLKICTTAHTGADAIVSKLAPPEAEETPRRNKSAEETA
ncbi:MAG: DUF502 domain-containing protein [Planctomycetota bacterium]|jgi:uncharacterized membrane protein